MQSSFVIKAIGEADVHGLIEYGAQSSSSNGNGNNKTLFNTSDVYRSCLRYFFKHVREARALY
jgi:hypothetical protein